MQRTNRILLLVALILAVLSGLGVYRFFARLEAMAVTEHTEEVVVAERDIPARTRITSEMVATVSVPKGTRHPGAAISRSQVIGEMTTQPIVAGEQVLLRRIFASAEQSGLSYIVQEGFRAVSVGINQRIAVAYMLRPGDFVDVVASFDSLPDEENDIPREQQSKLVLQRIEVLAVGQELRTGAAVAVGAETITLSVRPADAEKLIWAEDYGKIRLLLRPTADQGVVVTPGVNARVLEIKR